MSPSLGDPVTWGNVRNAWSAADFDHAHVVLPLLRNNEVEVGRNQGLGTLASVAFKSSLIGESTLQAALGLGVLRNLAVHGSEEDLDATRALEFLKLADAVLYSLGASYS